MPSNTKTAAVVAGGVALFAAGALAINFIDDDPSESVGSINLGAVNAANPGQTSPGGSSQQVIALEELTGTFVQAGIDADDFAIGGVELDLGPESWVLGADALEDYDGDGRAEPLTDELNALVDTSVRVLVRYDDDRDDADVYVINDLPYRDTAGGPARWQVPVAGETATREQLIAAAEAAVGEGARVTDLDQDDGTAGWEAEVIAADGREHNVILSATAEVLEVRQDD